MEHLFFNSGSSFSVTSKQFFTCIGVANFLQGDSANTLGGTYCSVSLFGMVIKIEENAYDFEDDYNYMVTIRRDSHSSLKVGDSVAHDLALLVSRLLVDNQQTPVARETANGLVLIEPA